MKRQRNRMVRSVSLALVSLILFLAGWGHAFTGETGAANPKVQKTVTASKEGKSATANRTDAPTETQVSTTAFEAVVTPATSFDFTQTVWLLPPPIMAVLLLLASVAVGTVVSPSYFYFSYFRHVFGHFIAPNAP